MKKITRVMQYVAMGVLATMTCLPLTAAAQKFPQHPIKVLVPFPPGGGTDFVSRIVFAKLSEMTGWQVVIENRPGAGGNLAIEVASKAAPDGYTLVVGQTDNMMLGPWLYSSLTYDSVKSFAPIINLSTTPLGLGSAASGPIKTPEDLIKKGKTADGLKWATAGAGTLGHLVGEDFKNRTNINLLQVPYKGAAPAIADVMGGQVDVYVGTLASLSGLVKGGKMNLVGVASGKRSPQFPNGLTLDESVAKGMDFSIWLGLFAPAGTPPAIIALINTEVNKVLKNPDVISKLEGGGVVPGGGTTQEFAQFVKQDYANWGKLAKASGIKLD